MRKCYSETQVSRRGKGRGNCQRMASGRSTEKLHDDEGLIVLLADFTNCADETSRQSVQRALENQNSSVATHLVSRIKLFKEDSVLSANSENPTRKAPLPDLRKQVRMPNPGESRPRPVVSILKRAETMPISQKPVSESFPVCLLSPKPRKYDV
jgi:hypothetical protein